MMTSASPLPRKKTARLWSVFDLWMCWGEQLSPSYSTNSPLTGRPESSKYRFIWHSRLWSCRSSSLCILTHPRAAERKAQDICLGPRKARKRPKNGIPREILLTDLVHPFEAAPTVGGRLEHLNLSAKMNVKKRERKLWPR